MRRLGSHHLAFGRMWMETVGGAVRVRVRFLLTVWPLGGGGWKLALVLFLEVGASVPPHLALGRMGVETSPSHLFISCSLTPHLAFGRMWIETCTSPWTGRRFSSSHHLAFGR